MPVRNGKARDGSLLAALFVLTFSGLGLLLLPYLPPTWNLNIIPSLLVVTFVLSGVWIGLRLMGPLFERVTASKTGSYAQARSMWRVVSYVALGVVLVGLTFAFLGDVTSTALGLGLLGAALAFVLQKPLLNVVGWLLVNYRGVYRIGDRIEVNGVRGYVTDVNLMYTELQEFGNWMHGDTFTGRLVTVPNATVVEAPTWNYTRDFPLLWDEVEVLVSYESDVEVAKRIMVDSAMEVVGRMMFESHEMYRKHLALRDLENSLITTPEIRMEFADSGVKLWVLYFCPAEVRRRMKGMIVEKIWRRFQEDPRVEIAYPHLAVVPGGKSLQEVVEPVHDPPRETRVELGRKPRRKR